MTKGNRSFEISEGNGGFCNWKTRSDIDDLSGKAGSRTSRYLGVVSLWVVSGPQFRIGLFSRYRRNFRVSKIRILGDGRVITQKEPTDDEGKTADKDQNYGEDTLVDGDQKTVSLPSGRVNDHFQFDGDGSGKSSDFHSRPTGSYFTEVFLIDLVEGCKVLLHVRQVNGDVDHFIPASP